MRKRFIQSNLPFVAPTNEETDQEFVTGEAHATKIIPYDSPKSLHIDVFQPPSDEEHSMEFMFDDDSAYVGALPLISSFKMMQKPSLKHVYDFGLSSSSSEHVVKEIQINDNVQATQGGEIETNPPQGNPT